MSLISNITEFKKYIAIDGNLNMKTLQPFIDEAELLYIKPLLGDDFYDEFHTAYQASIAPSPTALDADLLKLQPYLQRTLAYYTMLQALPHLTTTVGEMGVRVHRSDDSDAAARWQIEKLQFNNLRNGDIHADLLLEFLEQNATQASDPSPKYETWYESPANTKNAGYLVYNTSIASKHIDINNSRRVFLKLRNKMREIEKFIVPKLIGQAQYDSLVNQIKTDIITPASEKLMTFIDPIICKQALFLQLQFMRVQITENGIFVYSGTDDLFKLGQLATDVDIKTLKAQLMDGALGYLADEQRLQQFILDNINDYPDIKASPVYTVQPSPGPTFQPNNSAYKKHFIG